MPGQRALRRQAPQRAAASSAGNPAGVMDARPAVAARVAAPRASRSAPAVQAGGRHHAQA
ncbi:hypothetical protein AN652_19355 [Xanthomonas arboricola pv. pruni]|uniref:hypothetical protein n=1 Tax=Xanthomonas arboricola TaxID=56448 RepID=UPI0002E2BD1D|nr:hypothetical protein [Xanthomonas arboricola]KCX01253.1 hypothetical protein DK27_12235 [Xanthomonas arboricola pv. pruni]AKU49660.1 hypothetical protein AKJ12_07605 [Xanthomonas arboricola pv. juglandis]KOA98893.1 hypothetical protein AE921_13520 [Xanthomonas arboricola]KOB11108.1 hypothetical protein AE923_04775 [Xanthomonas arboricola]KOB11251.1 hypothetical protein AE922_02070 [Xanthomonas arboricola]